MTDISNSISPFGGIFYINGFALQITYPNAVGNYWMYNGMSGSYALADELATEIKSAGMGILDIGRTAPAISPQSELYNPRNWLARWGNNATVDAANSVREEFGILARNIGMDLNVPGRPQNWVQGTRADLSYETFSWSQGRTLHLDEIKAQNYVAATSDNLEQAARYGNKIAEINAASSSMRAAGAVLRTAGRYLGAAGLAYDVYSTSRNISADLAQNDTVGVGREVAGFGGRWAGMTAGASLGAWGYAAGPVVGTITTIGGGIAGSIVGEQGVTAAYNTIFGAPPGPAGMSDSGSLGMSGSGSLDSSDSGVTVEHHTAEGISVTLANGETSGPSPFEYDIVTFPDGRSFFVGPTGNVWASDGTFLGTINTNGSAPDTNQGVSNTAAQPSDTGPVTTGPVTTAPVTTGPVTTDPVTTDPVTTDPVTTGPVTTGPVPTDPVTTDPVTTDPVVTDPVVTDPVVTDPGGGGKPPVVLDLSGKGINVTRLSSSNEFFDMSGDGSGLQHLTAWAGVGNGVLFFDPTGTGQLTQANQIIFTKWDPGATSDMQALLDVFDTNHDGMLDSGDTNFNSFFVMVTNPDGTQTAHSLASLGITSINLNADATNIALPDGSAITGETSYTTTSGTTGLAATVSFATDPMGYVVTSTTTSNTTDGSVTIDNTAAYSDGSVAFQRILNTLVSSSTVSGVTTTTTDRTLTTVNNGGVVMALQTDDIISSGNVTSETVTNYRGGTITSTGELTSAGTSGAEELNATSTTTVSSGGTVTTTILRDQLGGGWTSQKEVDTTTTSAGGPASYVISNLNFDGTASDVMSSTVTNGGLTRTTTNLIDGNSAMATTTVDATVVGSGGTIRRGACNQIFSPQAFGCGQIASMRFERVEMFAELSDWRSKKIFTRPPHLGEAARRAGSNGRTGKRGLA